MPTTELILTDVLDRWAVAIAERRPDDVAAQFTEDAIFQGLQPYGVGRQAIIDYYAGQPVGLVASYRILETRRPAPGVALGYLAVDFAFTDRAAITARLGVVLTETDGRWLISHYQVS